MLVLSRKEAEAIQIGGGITVRVLDVRRGRVRLGIEAPESVRVRRSEVADDQAPPSPLQKALATRSRSITVPLTGQAASG